MLCVCVCVCYMSSVHAQTCVYDSMCKHVERGLWYKGNFYVYVCHFYTIFSLHRQVDFAAPVGYQEPQRVARTQEGGSEADGQVTCILFNHGGTTLLS